MMIKYRVREVAKDLDIPNKDVIDILAKYFPEPKINREVNSLPPRLHVSCVFIAIPSFCIFQ